jgi:hypothetical protein
MTVISACGLLCNECPYFEKECQGCFSMKGKPFWAVTAESGICALFDCSVNKKQFRDCGGCAELPCKMFLELKDPNISEIEHKKSIQLRVDVLRGK